MLDLDAAFGRRRATLEIGFGNGDNLAALATAHPSATTSASECIVRASAACCSTRDAQLAMNCRVIARTTPVEVLRDCIAPGALDKC